jgi:hypothetical protein
LQFGISRVKKCRTQVADSTEVANKIVGNIAACPQGTQTSVELPVKVITKLGGKREISPCAQLIKHHSKSSSAIDGGGGASSSGQFTTRERHPVTIVLEAGCLPEPVSTI